MGFGLPRTYFISGVRPIDALFWFKMRTKVFSMLILQYFDLPKYNFFSPFWFQLNIFAPFWPQIDQCSSRPIWHWYHLMWQWVPFRSTGLPIFCVGQHGFLTFIFCIFSWKNPMISNFLFERESVWVGYIKTLSRCSKNFFREFFFKLLWRGHSGHFLFCADLIFPSNWHSFGGKLKYHKMKYLTFIFQKFWMIFPN